MKEENKIITLEEVRNALHAAGDPWTADETTISSLSRSDLKKHLGATPPVGVPTLEEMDHRWRSTEMSQKAAAIGAVNIPSAYDLRNVSGKNFVTLVKDQNSCGSCVAFGTVATVECQKRIQNNNPNLEVDLSEAHLFFCGCDSCCDTGWWPDKAFAFFQNTGVVDEACYPYDSGLSKKDCSGLCSDWPNRVTKIRGYTNLTGNAAEIKKWVSTIGPVCACFIVYDDFRYYQPGQIYKYVTGDSIGGHCVAIVGYNDNPGYWICKNSWKPLWGDHGFFNIAYGQCGIDSWSNYGVNGI